MCEFHEKARLEKDRLRRLERAAVTQEIPPKGMGRVGTARWSSLETLAFSE